MDRRNFLKIGMSAVAVAGMPFSMDVRAEEVPVKQPVFSIDGNRIRLQQLGLKKPVRLLVLADSHLTIDDERGVPYKDYSKRMAQYFSQSIQNLEKITTAAQKQKYDMILMLGDMVSFPTAKGIETLLEAIKPLETPFAYIAGNHDWHYEGEEGTEIEFRYGCQGGDLHGALAIQTGMPRMTKTGRLNVVRVGQNQAIRM